MKKHFCLSLLLLLAVSILNASSAFCEAPIYQAQSNSCHDDHLNDETDDFPNNYKPFIVPVDINKQITVAPFITCTKLENDTWYPCHRPCKLAQTISVDDDWSDKSANCTYIFEDWVDYDWNDIIVNLYASTSDGIIAELLLAFREAAWKNPFGLEITAQGTWIKIEWNSTDFPNLQSLMIRDGETAEIDLFEESIPGKEAFIRFLIPPVVDFSWQPPQPHVGQTVTFDASTSYDPDKEIEAYSWNFGDGTSAETSNPEINHSFASPGTFQVNLTVIDCDGLTNTTTKTVQVTAVIGGETTQLDNTLVTVWRNISIILIIAFAAVAALTRRKKR